MPTLAPAISLSTCPFQAILSCEELCGPQTGYAGRTAVGPGLRHPHALARGRLLRLGGVAVERLIVLAATVDWCDRTCLVFRATAKLDTLVLLAVVLMLKGVDRGNSQLHVKRSWWSTAFFRLPAGGASF